MDGMNAMYYTPPRRRRRRRAAAVSALLAAAAAVAAAAGCSGREPTPKTRAEAEKSFLAPTDMGKIPPDVRAKMGRPGGGGGAAATTQPAAPR